MLIGSGGTVCTESGMHILLHFGVCIDLTKIIIIVQKVEGVSGRVDISCQELILLVKPQHPILFLYK